MDELRSVLAGLGLAQYADAFRAADVDLSLLPMLTDADLKEIGLSLGNRRKLLAAIAGGVLDSAPAPPAPAPLAPAHTGEEQWRQVTVMFCDLVDSTFL